MATLMDGRHAKFSLHEFVPKGRWTHKGDWGGTPHPVWGSAIYHFYRRIMGSWVIGRTLQGYWEERQGSREERQGSREERQG